MAVCPLLFLMDVLGREAAWSIRPSVVDVDLVHLPPYLEERMIV